MPERIKREYRLARIFSTVGAVFLYLLFIYCLIALVLLAAVLALHHPTTPTRSLFPALALMSHVSTAGAVLFMAEFLRRFRKAGSPFSSRQSLRLSGAAALLVVRTLIDQLVPTFDPIATSAGAVIVPQSGLDLKVIVMIVFLICLAMVVRYGDALKEDSDAFV